MHPLKTNDVIDLLAKDAKSSAHALPMLTPKTFALAWLVGAAFIFALSLWLLPVREDLMFRLTNPDFFVLGALWLAAAGLHATLVYRSTFPGLEKENRWLERLTFLPLILLFAWVLFHFPLSDFSYEMHREQNYLNGGCGAVILVAGAIHAAFLMRWVKRGAPTSLAKSGALTALSTGCFTSFLIQFACGNEHPIHVILWHAVPLTALALAMGFAAKKILKW